MRQNTFRACKDCFLFPTRHAGGVRNPEKPAPMAIYGTALLSICLLAGLVAGKLLGSALGVEANVGGVGIAMLLLMVATDWLRRRGALSPPSETGIVFWSAIYIPVVVAIAATQNVRAAVHGGPAAVLAGTLAVALCFALVPVISRMGGPRDSGGEK